MFALIKKLPYKPCKKKKEFHKSKPYDSMTNSELYHETRFLLIEILSTTLKLRNILTPKTPIRTKGINSCIYHGSLYST